MPQNLAEVQIGLGNWIYDQAKKGNITNSSAQCLNLLKANFTNNITIEAVGDMATDNTIFMPSYVRGVHKVGDEDHEFYIWFADAYFQRQFPRVQFTIVHPLPIEEMDTLMTMNFKQMAARIALETPDVIEDRTHRLTNQSEHPFTERRVVAFDVVDPINNEVVKMYWRYLSYGNSEDSEDQLFEQIIDEILSHSKYSREEWEDKIPDLFNPIEHYVIPYFQDTGLTNKVNGAKTYSPIVDVEKINTPIDVYIKPFMSEAHVIKSMQVLTFLYKSLKAAFVAKEKIRVGLEKVSVMYPDYQLIPATDSDFDLMSSTTSEFILQMENLFAAAETVTPNSLPPTGISRIIRNGKVCVTRRVGKAKFVVVTRWQYIEDGVVTE